VATVMLTGSNFQELVDYFCVASWLFYLLAGSCVIVLRWREPKLKRPFRWAVIDSFFIVSCLRRVWLAVPIFFCSVSLLLLVATAVQNVKATVISLVCIIIGIPVCVGWWFSYVNPSSPLCLFRILCLYIFCLFIGQPIIRLPSSPVLSI
jgi:amino acid transporter